MSHERDNTDYQREARQLGLTPLRQEDYIHNQQMLKDAQRQREFNEKQEAARQAEEKRNREAERKKRNAPSSTTSANSKNSSEGCGFVILGAIILYLINSSGSDQILPTTSVTLNTKSKLSGDVICSAKDERLNLRYIFEKAYLADGSVATISQNRVSDPRGAYTLDLEKIAKEAKSCTDAEKKINSIITPQP